MHSHANGNAGSPMNSTTTTGRSQSPRCSSAGVDAPQIETVASEQVLEVGCGLGLLQHLAPESQSYVDDISDPASTRCARGPGRETQHHVTLLKRSADQILELGQEL